MKFSYDPAEKAAIERVMEAFEFFIDAAPHFEIQWSDKSGYNYHGEDFSMSTENGSQLVKLLLCEVAEAALGEIKSLSLIEEANDHELEVLTDHFYPYMVELPEYDHLVPLVLEYGWRCVCRW